MLRAVLFAVLIVACGAAPVRAEVDAAAVSRAIDRGITYLRKSQSQRGNWDEFSGHSCGLSSLCTLALLNAGVSRDDPTTENAMKYLRATVADDTYSVSLQTLVFCQHGSAGDLPRIRNNVSWLTEEQKQTGVWGYGGKRQSDGDPSNSQFALLALGAAQDRGVAVDPQVFQRAINYWKSIQTAGGGWGYRGSTPTGSMTCAGVASLIIAQGRLGNSTSRVVDGEITCCGNTDDQQDPIADAARAILDGHIVLSRRLAEEGHYPAIDVEASISRVMPQVTETEHFARAQRFKQVYSRYQQARDLISVGAYVKGSDAIADAALQLEAELIGFLSQRADEVASADDAWTALGALAARLVGPGQVAA